MSPAEIFGLVNAVGGMFGFWGLYRISRLITANTASRAFIFLGAATSGAVILFFGHIENYTWALAFSLWTLSYAIGYHKNQKGMTGLILFSVLAVLFHAISVPVAVVAFVAVFLKNSPRGTSAWGISLTRINMAFVVGSVALAFAFHMKKQGILVPLWPVDGNPYAVISPEHLIDVLNQMALVAPLAVALILFGMLYERRRVAATGEEDAVLGTAALLFFLASFWIDPNIGAVRDWDLLSYYGLPLTLWALLRFTKYFAQRRVSPGWVMAASVLIVIGIGPNLYEKNNPELAIDRLDKIIRDDVHYQPSYEWGNRCVAWVAILQQGMGRHDLAVEYLKRGLELAPQSYSGFLNLASIYYQKGELDSCLVYTKRAQAAKPDDPQITAMVYDLQRRMPWLDSAVTESETAVRLDSNNVEALTQHAYALDDRGRSREALTYFKRAYELAPGRYESIVNLGFCFAAVDMIDSAQYYVSKAYPMAPRDNKPILCCCLIAAAIDLNRRQEAVGYLNELERIAPNSPKLIVFKARIENMAP
jgi:tetratricopeptide (TPR) repeat protein